MTTHTTPRWSPWSKIRCWLLGHGPVDSVRFWFRDPESKDAREIAVMWQQLFGSSCICLRCGKPMLGEQP